MTSMISETVETGRLASLRMEPESRLRIAVGDREFWVKVTEDYTDADYRRGTFIEVYAGPGEVLEGDEPGRYQLRDARPDEGRVTR